LEVNRGIKSLSSLEIFLKVHTDRMLFVNAENDFCWSRDLSVGVEAQFGTRFLGFWVDISEISSRLEQNYI
jgi:hypothetical protein